LGFGERVQVENHRKEKEAMTSSRQMSAELGTSSSDAAQRRQLQKENAQLRVKLTELLRELEDVRDERERLGQPSDVVSRLQAKQIAQHADRTRAIEVQSFFSVLSVAGLTAWNSLPDRIVSVIQHWVLIFFEETA